MLVKISDDELVDVDEIKKVRLCLDETLLVDLKNKCSLVVSDPGGRVWAELSKIAIGGAHVGR